MTRVANHNILTHYQLPPSVVYQIEARKLRNGEAALGQHLNDWQLGNNIICVRFPHREFN